MGNTSSAVKGLASDLAGTTDICDVVADAWAASYVLPEETVVFALRSARQEFAFTSRALVTVSAETSTTTRKLVERFEYSARRVQHVTFESTGVVDRDCELALEVGDKRITIAVARAKEEAAKTLYKALVRLGQKQEENEREWELATQAMATAKDTVRLSEAGTQSLNQQSDETLAWMKTQYERTHPRCYKDVIVEALEAAKVGAQEHE
ncbi:unnamed protein product [Phytophthora fragariaefolia]|uniref:Unnamed protein product n=1 Tax=Phytophthora fragariaefolia TaxID=1490495 RepID=A0A9W6XS32_9STRA|nr:unnamed protein product [Phytophthora fragariaefolia]